MGTGRVGCGLKEEGGGGGEAFRQDFNTDNGTDTNGGNGGYLPNTNFEDVSKHYINSIIFILHQVKKYPSIHSPPTPISSP